MNNNLPLLNRNATGAIKPTERVLQFGTGNFLKGFVNAIFNDMNAKHRFDAGIIAVKLRPGNQSQIDRINAQEGLFTLNVRGVDNGEVVDRCEIVSCQTRAINPYIDYDAFMSTATQVDIAWVVSNTTEAGIFFDADAKFSDMPAASFPAKYTQWLYARYTHFAGATSAAVNTICCELIENNAAELHKVVIRHATGWGLPEAFLNWLTNQCGFYNSLVDRIVPGRPAEAVCEAIQQSIGFADEELLETEPYYLWAIEVAEDAQDRFNVLFPSAGIDGLVISHDLAYYRERKVRLLNGPHTATANLARLLGVSTVYEATCHPRLSNFMKTLMKEDIQPLIAGNPSELADYGNDIYQRFTNPFLKHEWRAISMNSISKWRARLMPLVLGAAEQGRLSDRLIASMACLLWLYRDEANVSDGDYSSALFNALQQEDRCDAIRSILAETSLWGRDLNVIEGFTDRVVDAVQCLADNGAEAYLESLLKGN